MDGRDSRSMIQSRALGPRTQAAGASSTAAAVRGALPVDIGTTRDGPLTRSCAAWSKPSGLVRSEGRSCHAAHRPTPVCSTTEATMSGELRNHSPSGSEVTLSVP